MISESLVLWHIEVRDLRFASRDRALVERQYKEVQATYDQVDLLRGWVGKRLVVRLFNSEQRAEAASLALERAGFDADSIEVEDVGRATSVYQGNGSTSMEAVVSGALGGAIWGSIVSAIAATSALAIPGSESLLAGNPQVTWAVLALSGTVTGALLGAILGLFVGIGVSEEDTYLYGEGVKQGTKLVRVCSDNDRALEAAQILRQVKASEMAQAA